MTNHPIKGLPGSVGQIFIEQGNMAGYYMQYLEGMLSWFYAQRIELGTKPSSSFPFQGLNWAPSFMFIYHASFYSGNILSKP